MHVPTEPFFASRTDLIALARRRYFEEGQTPTGIVSVAVFQSWARCQRLHYDPSREVEFEPVTASRTQLAMLKNRQLHEAWQGELRELDAMLAATSCAAMLTEPSGVLIGATCAGRAHEHLMPVATRLGVNLSEEAVGTTAPGVVARTGQAVTVHSAEHFFEHVRSMHCAAAPIRDIDGQLAGVLDISSEGILFDFDAAAVVGLYAGAIENRLLVSQSDQHLVLRFQVAASLLDTPVVALVGIDSQGKLAWRNGAAAKLLGIADRGGVAHSQGMDPCASDVALGSSLAQLASLPDEGAAPFRLPNGLLVWARAHMQAADGRRKLFAGHAVEECSLAGTPATESPQADLMCSSEVGSAEESPMVSTKPMGLRDVDRDVIARALGECKGNVSEVARKLRVSRGLIYRRMRESAG